MDIIGILTLVLTYILIGFGFAGGFALFRWTAKKWKGRNKRGGINRFRVQTTQMSEETQLKIPKGFEITETPVKQSRAIGHYKKCNHHSLVFDYGRIPVQFTYHCEDCDLHETVKLPQSNSYTCRCGSMSFCDCVAIYDKHDIALAEKHGWPIGE